MWDLGVYREGNIRVSTGKGRIQAITRNVGSGRVPEMWDLGEYQKCGIWASTRKVGSRRVLEMWDLGEYQKCGIWVSTKNVGFERVPGR